VKLDSELMKPPYASVTVSLSVRSLFEHSGQLDRIGHAEAVPIVDAQSLYLVGMPRPMGIFMLLHQPNRKLNLPCPFPSQRSRPSQDIKGRLVARQPSGIRKQRLTGLYAIHQDAGGMSGQSFTSPLPVNGCLNDVERGLAKAVTPPCSVDGVV